MIVAHCDPRNALKHKLTASAMPSGGERAMREAHPRRRGKQSKQSKAKQSKQAGGKQASKQARKQASDCRSATIAAPSYRARYSDQVKGK